MVKERRTKLSLSKRFSILEGLYEEAKALKAFPLKHPLRDLKAEMRIAKILRDFSKSS